MSCKIKPKQIFDQTNPESSEIDLVRLKKQKQFQKNTKNLKQHVQKQLKLLLIKDESLLKEYCKKKQELKKQKQKQSRLINDIQYKELLAKLKYEKDSAQKDQTQQLKNKLKQSLHRAYEKSLQSKRYAANMTKQIINEWKLQRTISQQKIYQLNHSRFQSTQTQRFLSRESNRKFFQQRHSMIVKRSFQQILNSESSCHKDQSQIQKLEKDLVFFKTKSSKQMNLIEQIESQILTIKQQSLVLSKNKLADSKISSSTNLLDFENKSQKSPIFKNKKKFSLPFIHNKIHHQI